MDKNRNGTNNMVLPKKEMRHLYWCGGSITYQKNC